MPKNRTRRYAIAIFSAIREIIREKKIMPEARKWAPYDSTGQFFSGVRLEGQEYSKYTSKNVTGNQYGMMIGFQRKIGGVC